MEGLKNNIITLVGDSLEELRKRIIANHEAAGQVAQRKDTG